MSGLLQTNRLNVVVEGMCPDFVEADFWSGLLVALDYYPTYLTVAMYTLSLYQHELYLLLVSLALTADTGINIALQYIIKQAPAYMGCGGPYEMPSFATEHAAVFVCMMSSFAFLWRLTVPSKKIFLLFLFLFSTQFARVYIGINTRTQLMVGSLVGVAEGLIFQAFIYFVVYPRRQWLMDLHMFGWRLSEYFEMQDTLTTAGQTAPLPHTPDQTPLFSVPLPPAYELPQQPRRRAHEPPLVMPLVQNTFYEDE